MKPVIDCYFQGLIPPAEAASTKCLWEQNDASAATGNDWKNEQDPKALMVDLDLNPNQNSFDLASSA